MRLDKRPQLEFRDIYVLEGMIADEAVPVQGGKRTKSAHQQSSAVKNGSRISGGERPVGCGVDTARMERGRLERPLALRLLRFILCLPLFASLPLFVF